MWRAVDSTQQCGQVRLDYTCTDLVIIVHRAHTHAETGELFTWGRNTEGQLGHGDYALKTVPQCVEKLRGRPVGAIACGRGHTLALLRVHTFSVSMYPPPSSSLCHATQGPARSLCGEGTEKDSLDLVCSRMWPANHNSCTSSMVNVLRPFTATITNPTSSSVRTSVVLSRLHTQYSSLVHRVRQVFWVG